MKIKPAIFCTFNFSLKKNRLRTATKMYEAESRTGAFDKGINFKHSNESNVENTKRLYEIITNGFKYAFIPELPFCPALFFKRI